ncbi:hypothetical protein IE53DRAFT_211770 [Violaceomyces palustris]|uniref:Uncharacterized protein n=1 Tax=Violaceomyces palustris TaxID=1673888 RepID=A0ACD0NQV1_9BASI|nr:hypothetical protein IE53DRAFT_211770 [Violaceomyces palustris]
MTWRAVASEPRMGCDPTAHAVRLNSQGTVRTYFLTHPPPFTNRHEQPTYYSLGSHHHLIPSTNQDGWNNPLHLADRGEGGGGHPQRWSRAGDRFHGEILPSRGVSGGRRKGGGYVVTRTPKALSLSSPTLHISLSLSHTHSTRTQVSIVLLFSRAPPREGKSARTTVSHPQIASRRAKREGKVK